MTADADEPRCGWPVRVSRVHTWRCAEPFGHDGDHAIRGADGRITDRAPGYTTTPIGTKASRGGDP